MNPGTTASVTERAPRNPQQNPLLATRWVESTGKPSLTARFSMAILAWAERLNIKYSKFGNPAVYDNSVFPWVAEIEDHWREIRAEMDRVLRRKEDLASFQDIATDLSDLTQDRGWKVFMFTGYGPNCKSNIRQCPETWRLLQKIPGLTTALYSILEPDKWLPPHRGPYNGVLRLHLGLLVPKRPADIAIRVDSRIYHWEEGKALVFDDSFEHEAWNRSKEPRVNLFVDFRRPLKFPANMMNWLLLHLAALTPYIRESKANHRKWERGFYRDSEKKIGRALS
ncbi:MAG: aspartyl/asparaginyl beta-hydroxylase domain-containing protein [Candidatus Acidiferrales bacterium]